MLYFIVLLPFSKTDLSGHALQLLVGSAHAVGGVPGESQCSDGGAHSPVAFVSPAHGIALIVAATGAAAPAVWATAVDAGIAVTPTHLEGGIVIHMKRLLL